jgi:hypothetical protein
MPLARPGRAKGRFGELALWSHPTTSYQHSPRIAATNPTFRSLTWDSGKRVRETSRAMAAVRTALVRTEVWTTVGRGRWLAANISPALRASSTPRGVRSTSVHPVKRFSAFQADSPWRSRISVGIAPKANLLGRAFQLSPQDSGMNLFGKALTIAYSTLLQ